ncbi:AAA domain-containing protein [Mycoplasmoides pirum]|uniref:AAA domain-containing protein n=1 Tax=Mycoplasmoides pirum TaxID=2122 RepID=UPI000485B7B6|nr:AAA domain-containing protein [Mycoplasmoides pirum]
MAADWSWLKNRLVSAKTKSNSFWLPTLSQTVIDIGELLKCASNIYDHSINGIINFINTNNVIEIDLKRLSDIPEAESFRRFGTTEDLFKIFQNEFSHLYKLLKKQMREFGDSSLFIGLPLIEGINEFGDFYRAPLLYIQVEMEPVNRFQKINLIINHSEFILNPTILGVEVNKRSILFQNKYDQSTLDIQQALNVFKDLNIIFKMPLTNEVIPFEKKGKPEFLEANKNQSYNALVNNVLLGIFDVKGDKLFQDFTTIMSKDPNAIDEVFANKRDLLFDHKAFNNNFKVGEIALISNIDIYQQLSIKHALMGDVVIEGPPGTGKSETILNILANIALNNKTALFVSEKTTAMDVVYNRLGKLKHIALYVPNLIEEKRKFYQQFVEYENYFEKEYRPELLNYSRSNFDSSLINEGYEKNNKIHNIYNLKINSGKHEYDLFDMLLNFSVLDTKNITVKDAKEFDDWISQHSDYQWLAKHNEYLTLEEEIIKDWKIENFNKFLNIYSHDVTDWKWEYLISQYLKSGIIELPKIKNPFFKAKNNIKVLYKKLKNQIEKYLVLKNYSSKSKANTIQWVITNNVNRESSRFFYSWYMQTCSASQLKDLLFLQNDIDKHSIKFEEETQKFINNCKDELHALIIKKFYNIYQTDKSTLLEMCRHGRNSNLKDISWWFKMYSNLLKQLYPIHIMSFETASILLENNKNLYDYVIIDEASQVFLERALPALYRASKYVVAGDTKQLRPSNFFQSRANYNDDSFDELDSDNIIETNEAVNAVSLIHFLKERARISTMLRYHYRSDFSNLIAFTNNHIYGNELIFMDKAIKSNQTFIVHNITNGRWQSNRNFEEAQALVNRIRDLTRTEDYDKSLGVITFNKTQTELIENLMDKMNDPFVNEWRDRYNENDEYIGLFVKNVENVQGDERDIILFSLGYDKSVSNYGPISKAEGENRLNVAITRAKHRIELFKTNMASEYNGWSSKIPGTRLLVEYLDYCEKQNLISKEDPESGNVVTASIQHLDSNFNKEYILHSVNKQLKQIFGKYFEINQNVVEGQYIFDFVFYRNGVPILAIDIDTPKFDSLSQFYERFLYKNIFMKKRGWNHFRIWTSEWIISIKNVLLNLQKKLSTICEFENNKN